MKPLGKIKTAWSPELAYAIGLIVTDGCLSNDGRHINFTSKDLDQIKNFQQALDFQSRIGRKGNGISPEKKYYYVQPGDVLFYRFLLDIGLTPNKTKTMGPITIPKSYFFDFLRGHFDGDGSTYSYWDPRWRSSFMFYTTFVSASRLHILWLQKTTQSLLSIRGHINQAKGCYQLKYAKTESVKLLQKLYPNPHTLCLKRKRLKIKRMFAIIGQRLY